MQAPPLTIDAQGLAALGRLLVQANEAMGPLRAADGATADSLGTALAGMTGNMRRLGLPVPVLLGTALRPCEKCGQDTAGNQLIEGWYRCRRCGYPSK